MNLSKKNMNLNTIIIIVISMIIVNFFYTYSSSSVNISVDNGIGMMSLEKKDGEKAHGNASGVGSSIYLSLGAGKKNRYGFTVGYMTAFIPVRDEEKIADEVAYLPWGILLETKANNWFVAQVGTIGHYHFVENKNYFGLKTSLGVEVNSFGLIFNNNFILRDDKISIENFIGFRLYIIKN